MMAQAPILLEARNVAARYGKKHAVRDVSFVLREGETATIIGANGAGKTTLLSALMGLMAIEGEARWFGRPISQMSGTEELVRLGVGLIPEKRELFGPMSVEDNLRLGAFLRRRDPAVAQTLLEVWRLFPRLLERRDQRASTLSGGERQMLAMGRALMAAPRVLMLDEPSLGLAPNIVREIFAIIAKLRERGVSILLVEQNARAALEAADFAYVMETGSFTLAGPANELARDPRVAESYLGGRPANGRN
jgi:branched-chain amino acid transport system ATP-binding protein